MMYRRTTAQARRRLDCRTGVSRYRATHIQYLPWRCAPPTTFAMKRPNPPAAEARSGTTEERPSGLGSTCLYNLLPAPAQRTLAKIRLDNHFSEGGFRLA